MRARMYYSIDSPTERKKHPFNTMDMFRPSNKPFKNPKATSFDTIATASLNSAMRCMRVSDPNHPTKELRIGAIPQLDVLSAEAAESL
jgi:hypothetical protein